MSYEKPYISRGRGRGRGGYNDGPSRPFTRYEDRTDREDFVDRGGRGHRRPMGNFNKPYVRDDYRNRDDRRDTFDRDNFRPRDDRRDTRERFVGRGREFEVRRSPDFRREIPRNRSFSPPRKEFLSRDIIQRGREMAPRAREFESRRSSPPRSREIDPRTRHFDIRPREFSPKPTRNYEVPKIQRPFEVSRGREFRREFSPPDIRERRFSPTRYNNDRYEGSPRRTYERNDFQDRRRTEFRPQMVRENREYRSRSPNATHPRGGRYRGTFNRGRFEGSQRGNNYRTRGNYNPNYHKGYKPDIKRPVDNANADSDAESSKSVDKSSDSS